jgi:hypothetical protein
VATKGKKSKQRIKLAKKPIKKAKKAARKETKEVLDMEIRDAALENTDLGNSEESGEEPPPSPFST